MSSFLFGNAEHTRGFTHLEQGWTVASELWVLTQRWQVWGFSVLFLSHSEPQKERHSLNVSLACEGYFSRTPPFTKEIAFPECLLRRGFSFLFLALYQPKAMSLDPTLVLNSVPHPSVSNWSSVPLTDHGFTLGGHCSGFKPLLWQQRLSFHAQLHILKFVVIYPEFLCVRSRKWKPHSLSLPCCWN